MTEISDSSEGGWWQASDGLWYPPEAAAAPPAPPSSPKRRSKVWVFAIVGVAAVIVAVGAVLALSDSDGTTDNTADAVSSPTTTASPATTAAPTTTISAAQRAADRAAELGLDCEITTAGGGRVGSHVQFDVSTTNPLNSRVKFRFAVDVFYTPSQLAIDRYDIKNPTRSWMGSADYMLSDDTPSRQTASASGYVEATEPILNLSELDCEIYALEYRSASGLWVSLFSR